MEILLGKKLMDTLWIFFSALFYESFYGKKNTINILIAFSISHKSSIKTFVNWFIIIC